MLKSVASRLLGTERLAIWLAVLVLAWVFFAVIFSPSAFAAQTVPYKVNYQGRITNSAGAQLADGNYNMRFRLYSVATGGTASWTETRDISTQQVAVKGGQFAIQLGDVTALSPSTFTSYPLYLEVELPTPATATCNTASCAAWTEGAMTPRQPLASSAYAMNADTLDGYDSSSFVLVSANNTFSGTNLFKNTTNSTAAFAVQKADGTSLLNVNTTNGTVALGYNTTTSSPVITLTGSGVGIGTASPTATLETDGSALFKSVTNSTTAFQIQSSSALSVLSADTTSNVVQVGSSTPDSIAVLLVLDTKNTAGDPAGLPGAMYYNSSLGKFRCYENGAWANCTGYQNVVTLASDVVNSNATANTIADVTGLSFAVVAGTTYHFSALINYTSAATTTGSRWAISGPASPTTLSYTSTYTLSATAQTVNYASTYDMPAASNAGSLTAGNTARIDGIITPSAAGTVIVRFASGVASSSVTAKAGSTLTWW